MSRIKVYDTHTEIINGLFIDIPDEEFTFLPENLNTIPRVQRQVRVLASRNIIRDESEGITREQFEAAYPRQSDGPDFDEAPFIIGTSPQGNYIVGFDPVLDRSDSIAVTRSQNQGIWHQLRNMSEQELIQYFDRISQEEEN